MNGMDDLHLRDPGKVRGWKRLLLAKGSEIAARLEQLLSGKEVDLSGGIPPPLLPADDPELRLRRFLEQIDRGIKRAATDRFGRCAVCGDALAAVLLDEAPWTERCGAHAAA